MRKKWCVAREGQRPRSLPIGAGLVKSDRPRPRPTSHPHRSRAQVQEDRVPPIAGVGRAGRHPPGRPRRRRAVCALRRQPGAQRARTRALAQLLPPRPAHTPRLSLSLNSPDAEPARAAMVAARMKRMVGGGGVERESEERGAGCREKVETVRRSEHALSPSRPVGRVFRLAPPQPPLIPSSSSSSPASPFFQSPVQGLPISSTRPGRGHPLPPTPSPAGERSMQLIARRSRISFQFFFSGERRELLPRARGGRGEGAGGGGCVPQRVHGHHLQPFIGRANRKESIPKRPPWRRPRKASTPPSLVLLAHSTREGERLSPLPSSSAPAPAPPSRPPSSLFFPTARKHRRAGRVHTRRPASRAGSG